MKIIPLVLLMILTSGCAARRFSLREIQDYDHAIKLAESEGMDSKPMHRRLVEMIVSYLKNPGMDPAQRAAQDAANAMNWQAAASMMQATKPEPYQPPMSPAEYRRGR